MDLNQLYFDHQFSLMCAGSARTLDTRDAHLDNAAVTARNIELFQRARNATAFKGGKFASAVSISRTPPQVQRRGRRRSSDAGPAS